MGRLTNYLGVCPMFYRSLISLFLVAIPLVAEGEEVPQQSEKPQFKPFTGRVTGSKVRLRIKPALDAPIVSELKAGDLFIVSGETEDFFSLAPPKDVRAYIHRKFVIDGAIDGTRVNVR